MNNNNKVTTTAPQNRHYYNPWFADYGRTERLSNLAKVIQEVSGPKFKPRQTDPEVLYPLFYRFFCGIDARKMGK